MCQSRTSEVVPLPANVDVEKEVRSVSLDRCLVPVIKAIWEAGFGTLSCCCGHDNKFGPPSVVIPQEYAQADIEAIEKVIRSVDARDWDILQWRLVKVNKLPAS